MLGVDEVLRGERMGYYIGLIRLIRLIELIGLIGFIGWLINANRAYWAN